MALFAIKGNRERLITQEDKQKFIEKGHKIIEIDDTGTQAILHDPKAILDTTDHLPKLKGLATDLGIEFNGNIGFDTLITRIKETVATEQEILQAEIDALKVEK